MGAFMTRWAGEAAETLLWVPLKACKVSWLYRKLLICRSETFNIALITPGLGIFRAPDTQFDYTAVFIFWKYQECIPKSGRKPSPARKSRKIDIFRFFRWGFSTKALEDEVHSI